MRSDLIVGNHLWPVGLPTLLMLEIFQLRYIVIFTIKEALNHLNVIKEI